MVDGDCELFVAVEGYAGCSEVVFADPLAEFAEPDYEGACCAWPAAGGWVFVGAWAGWEVAAPLEDAGAVVCACGEPAEALGEVEVEAGGRKKTGWLSRPATYRLPATR